MTSVVAAPSLDPLMAEARRRARRRRICVVAIATTAAIAGWALSRGGGARTGATPALPRLALHGAPGMGVACPGAPNSIACDRVVIAVRVQRPAEAVRVTIGGRTATLHHDPTCDWRHYREFCATSYTGALQPAGLIDGALKIVPDGGRLHWTGVHPKWATMTIRAKGYAPVRRRVPLAPGWG